MIDVSIVMPCLNESISIGHCVANAREALDLLHKRFGLSGEIIVADNGSTDGSRALAIAGGARVVAIERRGYGAAVRGGLEASRGRYLVMGDADGSYNFHDAVPMVEALAGGADLCMGSRFKGGIEKGAMPWKNRYIGSPILTGLLNVFYGAGISDAHCGIRALTRSCFDSLRLNSDGMELASEMVVKAALRGCVIAEVPATLSRDMRERPPHLRPWRDGWRHLRFLLLLSPTWLFSVPGLVLLLMGALLMTAPITASLVGINPLAIGAYWTILAGACMALGHQGLLLALTAELVGVRYGYRRPGSMLKRLQPVLSLEVMLIAGAGLMLAGLAVLVGVVIAWKAQNLQPFGTVQPAVIGTTLLTVGVQNVLGGFLLGVLAGSGAQLLAYKELNLSGTTPASQPVGSGIPDAA